MHRLDQELAAIATVNSLPKRHGRQYSSREDALMATVAKERELFEGAGFGKSVYMRACVRAGTTLYPIHPQSTAQTVANKGM